MAAVAAWAELYKARKTPVRMTAATSLWEKSFFMVERWIERMSRETQLVPGCFNPLVTILQRIWRPLVT